MRFIAKVPGHVQTFILKIETLFNKIYVMHCIYLSFTLFLKNFTLNYEIIECNIPFHYEKACDPEQVKIG